MIDALLYAVQDAILGSNFGYDRQSCRIMDDGHPPPSCGNVFVAVHQGVQRSDMLNCLNEYFDYSVTLTMRVSVPLDRIGDKLLASNLARRRGPGGQPSFNDRCNQLATLLHMDWVVLQGANDNLVNWLPDAYQVYGFSEPAHFAGTEVPVLVGGEWFAADPTSSDVGLKAEIRFEECRRGPQAIASYS